MQRLQYEQNIYGGNSLVEQERRDGSLPWGRILGKNVISKVSEEKGKELMLETVLIRFCKHQVLLLQFQKMDG